MLQVESCIELYCYAGCILSSKQMPRGITRSPPASSAPRELFHPPIKARALNAQIHSFPTGTATPIAQRARRESCPTRQSRRVNRVLLAPTDRAEIAPTAPRGTWPSWDRPPASNAAAGSHQARKGWGRARGASRERSQTCSFAKLP